jgi:hypothetical protein
VENGGLGAHAKMLNSLLAAHHENLAIAISVLAFVVSGFSLGWNVYRDVILKALRARRRVAPATRIQRSLGIV